MTTSTARRIIERADASWSDAHSRGVVAAPTQRTFGTAKLAKRSGRTVWVIEARPSVMRRMRRLLAGSDRAGKTVSIPDTLEGARDLAWICERWPLVIPSGDREHLDARAARHCENEDAIARMLAADYVPREFELALAPRDYQRLAAEMALRMRGMLLADEVGLGKTAAAICALTDPSTRPALVVTLTALPRQWARELQRFVPRMSVHVIRDGDVYDIAAKHCKVRAQSTNGRSTAHLFGGPNPTVLPDVIVTSYSKLAKWRDALSGLVRGVVFDEVQELRHSDSAKYAAASQIAEAADFRLGLSATPIYNYGGEIYSVLDTISPGALGTFTEFVAEWCVGSERKTALKDPRAFGMWAREQGLMLRRTRSEVGRELPACQKVVHHVDVDSKPLAEVEGRAAELAKIIMAEGGSGISKLQAGGELDWKLRQATGLAKAPFVADFVRLLVESGEPVVVFAWHHEVYALLRERLKGIVCEQFTGQESAAQKDQALQRFKGGTAKVLLMSLRSGAGLDGLQHACRTVVFAELDWSPGVHEQCLGRVYRDGQAQPVIAYFLTSAEGSDPIVTEVLGLKTEQVEALRDPDAALVDASKANPDHMRRLAESYLAKVGVT